MLALLSARSRNIEPTAQHSFCWSLSTMEKEQGEGAFGRERKTL